MEKSYEVTKIYLVQLCCDKCGEIMTYCQTDANDVFVEHDGFLYKCKKCGNEARSKNNYPYTKYDYNINPIEN